MDQTTSHTNEPILRLDRLEKRFGNQIAVNGIDLALEQSEFVTLLGPSGCGKTTTLMMVAGFEMPTGGDIRFDGGSLIGVPAHRRDFGMVFQNYALFPHMTVAENIGYPMRMRGIRGNERAEAVGKALALVRLESYGDRYPAQLSGGQQQRVALARALVFRPRLLLMDEPLGALDKNLREEMQFEIVRIQRESGATAIFVTHDQGEALQMSDRVAVMRDGRIEQIDTPQQLYESPVNAFVATFLGESNIIDYHRGDSGRAILAMGGTAPLPPDAPDKGLLFVRPERVRLSPDIPSGAVTVGATVEGVVYRGSDKLYRLACKDRTLTALVANRVGERDYHEGESVILWWMPEDAAIAEN